MGFGAVKPYRRSATQVALLHFATFGLYVFVWAFWVRRVTAAVLERTDQPIWKTVALIVPIFNLFLLFELGDRIEGMEWRVDPSRPQRWLGLIGASAFIFAVMGRIESPAAFIGLLGFVPCAVLQLHFERAQVALFGAAGEPTRFHWIEWIVVVLGAGFWVVSLIGVVMGLADGSLDRQAYLPAVVAYAIVVIAFVMIARAGRRAIASGRELHASPHPDAVGTTLVATTA